MEQFLLHGLLYPCHVIYNVPDEYSARRDEKLSLHIHTHTHSHTHMQTTHIHTYAHAHAHNTYTHTHAHAHNTYNVYVTFF